jgi:RNA polymerase-binding transcription factor DksA
MTYERLERFRRRLLGLRIGLLRRRRQALADEQGLMAEHEFDWTDVAANDAAVTVLEGLGETERQAVARIDASLLRMERGTYGECAICYEPIDDARLQAVPDADRCVRCALH